MIYTVYCLCAPKLGFHLLSVCRDSKDISHLIEFQNVPAFHSSPQSPTKKKGRKWFSYHVRELKQTRELQYSLGLLWLDAESHKTRLKGSLGGYVVHVLPQGKISWTRAFLTDIYLTYSWKPPEGDLTIPVDSYSGTYLSLLSVIFPSM